MVSQEIQTVSCLLRGRTGLIGTFPAKRPSMVVFITKGGKRLRLLGFNTCHPSVVAELGQKGVAGFVKGKGKKRISRDDWRRLSESANAVLFSKNGKGYKVEILKRVATAKNSEAGMIICFQKTGATDEFIPCRG